MPVDFKEIGKELLMDALQSSGASPGGSQDDGGSKQDDGGSKKDGGGPKSGGPLSGMKGVVAGVGAAALLPLAAKRFGNLAKVLGVGNLSSAVKSPAKALEGVTSNLGNSVGSSIGDKVSGKVDEAGGPSGILKDTVKDALPFGGGGGGGGKGGVQGVGKGRRMPVQQSIDIGVPIETVYNQWTQFEDWPTFMHRVTRVTQEDDCTLSFATKIWGKTKEFTAKIETQRPNERIKWSVSQGLTHTGVVTFHELGPNLTRVLLSFDVQPGGLIEKAARGMRHVKRAARADLHRFKALIEVAENETGAWRGVIEDGELVEEHDPSYDEDREYSDIDDLVEDSDEESEEEEGEDDEESKAQGSPDSDEESEEDEGEDDEDAEQQPKAKRSRRQRQSRNGGQGDESEEQSEEASDESDEQSSSTRPRSRTRASSSSRPSRSPSEGRRAAKPKSTSARSRGASNGGKRSNGSTSSRASGSRSRSSRGGSKK